MSYRTDLSRALKLVDEAMQNLRDVIEYHFSDDQKPLPPNVMQRIEMELENAVQRKEEAR